MISPLQSERLARALADEIAATVEPVTARLIEDLLHNPGTGILLGHESGWLDLVWRSLEIAELADVTSNDRYGS